MSLPFPAGLLPVSARQGASLDGFLREMKKREGQADLIERRDDSALGGVRFVAGGGVYKVRVNLVVHGARAWFVYVGTRQDQPVDADELALGERARDGTVVGIPKD